MLFLSALSFAVPTSAHAADSSWNNIDVVKKVIENVAPVVSSTNTASQNSAASLVFSSDEFVQKPLISETQITPEPKPVSVVKKKTIYTQKTYTQPIAQLDTSGNHNFPYGYCTYYVSQKRNIPWSGNAIAWLSGARAYGFATGSAPQAGAIMVTSEGGYAGHVAMVDSVDGDQITVSEMNYKGWGIVSSRIISAASSFIMGFIY